jgi:peptidoglycan hydrolase FlgJ
MSTFYSDMYEPAKLASSLTGIPVQTILAQWALESNYGQSDLAKRANNFAGIKANSKGRDYVSGQYAGYFSKSSFAKDYARVMNLSYYDAVREAGTVEGSIDALDKSPWAEDTNYGDKLREVVKKISGIDLSDVQVKELNYYGWALGGFVFWWLFIR